MATDDSKWEKALIGEVRRILLREWDPAGVGTNPKLADEYDFVLGKVMAGLGASPDRARIAALLFEIERDDLGITDRQRGDCDPAAKSLTALRLANDPWPVTGD
jgi:hypothetical protein